MLYIIQSVIMKALWDPEAGRLLSLCRRSSIQKKAGERDGRIRGNGELESNIAFLKKAIVTKHENKSKMELT